MNSNSEENAFHKPQRVTGRLNSDIWKQEGWRPAPSKSAPNELAVDDRQRFRTSRSVVQALKVFNLHVEVYALGRTSSHTAQ